MYSKTFSNDIKIYYKKANIKPMTIKYKVLNWEFVYYWEQLNMCPAFA